MLPTAQDHVYVVIAPDSFGGTLAATEAAEAIAQGWRDERPDDQTAVVPMSDGGEGLLDVVALPSDERVEVEVAGPLGLPVIATMLLRDDVAIIESAQACGLHLVPEERRDPLRTTTYGVGQLLDAAREAGARRILVGLGGSATVDGGAGALTGMGFRIRVADGSGLKIGGNDLHRVRAIEQGWVSGVWGSVEVRCLADVRDVLADAPAVYGPQKGADADAVALLEKGLAAWDDVARRDLGAEDLAAQPGTGAAGGLGFGLAAGIGALIEDGADAVAELVGLQDELARADVVVTGEGRIDATSFEGKVVGAIRRRSVDRGLPLLAVAGQVHGSNADRLDDIETASATSPQEARSAIRAAAARLARSRRA